MDAFVVHVLELCSGSHWNSWSTFHRAHRRGCFVWGGHHEKPIYLVEQQEYNHRSAELCQSCFLFQNSTQYWDTYPGSWTLKDRDRDRSSHSEVAWCTLLHSYTKLNRNNLYSSFACFKKESFFSTPFSSPLHLLNEFATISDAKILQLLVFFILLPSTKSPISHFQATNHPWSPCLLYILSA